MGAQAWHDLFDTCVFEIKHDGALWAMAGAGKGVERACLGSRRTGTHRRRAACPRRRHVCADVQRFKEELLRLANALLA